MTDSTNSRMLFHIPTGQMGAFNQQVLQIDSQHLIASHNGGEQR